MSPNSRESSSRAGAVGLVVGFVPFVGPGRLDLAKYTAVGLNVGDAFGKERAYVSWRVYGHGLVGVLARDVAETVGRVVNHQEPAWPQRVSRKSARSSKISNG